MGSVPRSSTTPQSRPSFLLSSTKKYKSNAHLTHPTNPSNTLDGLCSKVCYLMKGENPFAEKGPQKSAIISNPPIIQTLSVCCQAWAGMPPIRIVEDSTKHSGASEISRPETGRKQYRPGSAVSLTDQTRTPCMVPGAHGWWARLGLEAPKAPLVKGHWVLGAGVAKRGV